MFVVKDFRPGAAAPRGPRFAGTTGARVLLICVTVLLSVQAQAQRRPERVRDAKPARHHRWKKLAVPVAFAALGPRGVFANPGRAAWAPPAPARRGPWDSRPRHASVQVAPPAANTLQRLGPAGAGSRGAADLGRASARTRRHLIEQTTEPEVAASDRGILHYEEIRDGVLFPEKGPLYLSLNQGKLNNCFAMGALAAVAAKNEPLVKSLFESKGSGACRVNLFAPEKDGKFEREQVDMSTRLPVDSMRRLRYAGAPKPSNAPKSKRPLWAALIEKALVAYNGKYHVFGREPGYEGMNHGSAPARVIRALTGRRGTVCSTAWSSEDKVWAAVKRANRGDYVTCNAAGGTREIPGPHTYAVLGGCVKKGKRYVTLYNPWGFHPPEIPNAGKGVFSYPLSDFMDAFQILTMVPRD